MAKQTELKHLLQELEIATRHHERCLQFRPSIDECNRAFHAADVAEKRVFSFFDKLNTELEDSARAYKSLQEQRNYLALERDEARKAAVAQRNVAQKAKADLQELAQQVMAMKPTDASSPAAPSEPFNDARARAGDPIEVLMAADVWIEKQFIGTFVDGRGVPMVSYVHEGEPDWVGVSQVRMKSKAAQQLQMFANVYRGADGHTYGFLYSDSVAVGAPPPGAVQLVENAPVTFTVAN